MPNTDDPYTGNETLAAFQQIDLTYLIKKPRRAVKKFPHLMLWCLKANNPEAHYIQGVMEYFHNRNTTKGLDHLLQSFNGECKTVNTVRIYTVYLCFPEATPKKVNATSLP